MASQASGGFALERRASLMLTTVFIAAVGVNRTLLQLFLGERSVHSSGLGGKCS